MEEEGRNSKLVARVRNKFFIVTLVRKTDKPTDEEMLKVISAVMGDYQQLLKSEQHSLGTPTKVVEVEYFWDWERDKESGKMSGSLFDHPHFNGVAGMKYFSPLQAEKLLPILEEEFGNE
jgi:hypothetical protein